MPVPEYGGLKVATAPVTGARVADTAAAAAFGVPARVDLGGAATQLTDYVQRQKDNADSLVVNTAGVDLGEFSNHVLTQATTAQGVNALGAAAAARQAWDQHVSDTLSGLTNDRQKMMVQQRAMNLGAALHENLERHVGSQITAAHAATTDAQINQNLQAVQRDPTVAPDMAEHTAAAVRDYWSRVQGQEEPVVQQHVQTAVSNIHMAAVVALTNKNTLQYSQFAKSYLDAHADEMTPEQESKAYDLVDTALTQSHGFADADKILGINQSGAPQPEATPGVVAPDPFQATPATAPVPPPKKSRVQALLEAEAIPDDARRQAAMTKIMAHFRDLDAAAKGDREDALQRLTPQVEAAGGIINKATPDWKLIDGTVEGEALMSRSKQLLHPPAEPPTTAYTTMLNTYGQFPELFASEDLRKEYPGMSSKEYVAALKLQANAAHAMQGRDRADDKAADKEAAARLSPLTVWKFTGNPPSPAVREAMDRLSPRTPVGPSSLPVVARPLSDMLHQSVVGTPTKTPTPQMLQDAKTDPQYAALLRLHGFNVP